MDSIIIIIIIACIALVLWVIWGAYSSMGIETPKYRIIRKLDNGVEIRRYGKSTIARTVVKLAGGPEESAFYRIAGYIFGGNSKGQKIAMTAPVVTRQRAQSMEMSFILPKEYKLEDLPKPTDNNVVLATLPARTIAVIRFSGYANDRNVSANEKRLLYSLENASLAVKGTTFLMQYNAPWTPPFMRRNEIGVEIGKSEVAGARLREISYTYKERQRNIYGLEGGQGSPHRTSP